MSDVELEALTDALYGLWAQQVAKVGFSIVRSGKDGENVGVDVRRVSDAKAIADYVAKNGYEPRNTSSASAVAYEVTGSHSKIAGKGRMPFQILGDVVAHDESLTELAPGEWVDKHTGELVTGARVKRSRRDLALWHEWLNTSHRRRQLTWSRGLRVAVGLVEVEQTDEEIAAAATLNGEPVILDEPIQEHEIPRLVPLLPQALAAAEAGTLAEWVARWRGAATPRFRRRTVRGGPDPEPPIELGDVGGL